MRRYAEDTAVPISRTRGEIDRLLRDWGAEAIAWSDDFRHDSVNLRFVWPKDAARFMARFRLRLPTRKDLEADAIDGRTGRVSEIKMTKLLDERGKREHRTLLLWLKGALNAVDLGLVSAEAIFLPFLEGKDGQTVAEVLVPRMGVLLEGSAELLLPSMEERA
jgi:hypothetical protein